MGPRAPDSLYAMTAPYLGTLLVPGTGLYSSSIIFRLYRGENPKHKEVG